MPSANSSGWRDTCRRTSGSAAASAPPRSDIAGCVHIGCEPSPPAAGSRGRSGTPMPTSLRDHVASRYERGSYRIELWNRASGETDDMQPDPDMLARLLRRHYAPDTRVLVDLIGRVPPWAVGLGVTRRCRAAGAGLSGELAGYATPHRARVAAGLPGTRSIRRSPRRANTPCPPAPCGGSGSRR
jgi:hypothetical protein